jgi:hypothetical protein
MFGAEPQENWDVQDRMDFERNASIRLRACVIAALRAGVLLLLTIGCLFPFMAGHYLNRYWDRARILVYFSLASFLWFFYKVRVYASDGTGTFSKLFPQSTSPV